MNDFNFQPQSNAGTSPIEFRCSACSQLLRVSPQMAGKQARCPQCGQVALVPAQSPGAVAQEAAVFETELELEPTMPTTAQPPMNPIASQPPATRMQPAATPTAPPQPANPGEGRSVARLGAYAGSDEIHASTYQSPTRALFDRICAEISKVYVGQDELVLGTLVALFSGGHVLIESVPGLGKTLLVRTLGKVMGCEFGRIQFTADLMPSDITGAPVFNMKTSEFKFHPGPVFTQLLLADEINRSPAKTHAALLEIMQEFRVTVDGTSHELSRPFLVMATQNPIESEGTYNLPEAQLDRFMFKLIVNYPSATEEASILKLHSNQQDFGQMLEKEIAKLCSPEEILRIAKDCEKVRIDDLLLDYINNIVRLTRQWPQFHMGASPRAGLALMQSSRTLAALMGRDYAVPDDVVQLVLPVLRHRVILTAEAEVEGHNVDDILGEMIRTVEVPRIR